jgi:hypothetical protein
LYNTRTFSSGFKNVLIDLDLIPHLATCTLAVWPLATLAGRRRPLGTLRGALPRVFQRSSFMHAVHIFFDLRYAPVKKTCIPECPLVFLITLFYFEILIARSTFATQF